jgi:hypothetical protein
MADLDGAVLQIHGDIVVILRHIAQELAQFPATGRVGKPSRMRGALAIIGGILHISINHRWGVRFPFVRIPRYPPICALGVEREISSSSSVISAEMSPNSGVLR